MLAFASLGCSPDDEPANRSSLESPPIQVAEHAPEPRARFVRLTHLQWERSVQDLFSLVEPTGLSATFLPDGGTGGFSTDSAHLEVTHDLWVDYQRAAEEVAQFVARSPERLARIVDLDWSSDTQLTTGCLAEPAMEVLADCCEGEAKCVPAAMVDPSLHARLSKCKAGGLCAPRDVVIEVNLEGFTAAESCTAQGGSEGACLSPCFPDVAAFANFMHQGTCDEGLLCAPCINPLDNKDSGACAWEMRCPEHGMTLSAYIEKRDDFIARMGRRIFRRPLKEDELSRYAQVFEVGVNELGSGDFLAAGAEFLIRTMLQSPHFLFRIESSRDVGASGYISLAPYEVAARLSLTLWNTTPSDAMLDAAGAGEFGSVNSVYTWVLAMLADDRATETLIGFHEQLLHTSTYSNIQKDPTAFPDFDEDTAQAMADEFELFVADVIAGEGGGLTALLTSTHTFVNRKLAPIYGLDGADFGEGFERVELDPTKRSGILTRSGFLADRASINQPDPIRRGVLIAERIICAELPPPPPDIQGLPGDSAPTNRERVELHTGEGTCGQGCHTTLINPAGFPFEHYDAIGAYRTEDNGYPVNAADSYSLDGAEQSYADALEFSQTLADSQQVHRCYADHWLEFVYGREPAPNDEELLDALARASHAGELGAGDIVAILLASEAFTSRSQREYGEEEAQ